MPEDVEIKIRSTADLKGFEQAKRAGDELAQQAIRQNREAAGGAGNAEEAANRAAAAKRNWKEAIRGVALEFPVLGRFATAALNPISAGVGLAIAAFAGLQQALRNVQAAADVSVPFENSTKALQAQKNAIDEVIISSAAYQRSLDAVANSTETVSQKTTASIEALRNKSRLETELSSAEEAAALSQIDAQEKLGTLTGPQAIAARLEVQRRFAQQREEIRAKEEAETQRLRQGERGALRGEASTLDQAIAAQEGKIAGLTSPAEFDARLAIAERNRAAAREQREKRETAAEKFGVSTVSALPDLVGRGVGQALDVAGETDVQLEDQLNRLVQGLQGGRAGAVVEFQSAQEELQRLRARRTAVEQRSQAVGGELEGGVRTGILEEQFRPQIRAAQQRAREAGPLAELVGLGTAPPPSEFSGTAAPGAGLEAIGTAGAAAAKSVDGLGAATLEALHAIATQAEGHTRAIEQIREQLRNNRPPQ